MPIDMQKIHLITRADDAGSCRSANEAILEAVEAGITKNVSFMACGPEIEHAVELLGGRDDIAYGFHVCLNAEWEDVKWGPIRGFSIAADKDGYFLPFPNDTKVRVENEIRMGEEEWKLNDVRFQFDVDDYYMEIQSEIRVQLDYLKELGLPISYIDEHMGISWIGFGIREEIIGLCERDDLVYRPDISSLPNVDFEGEDISCLDARFKATNLNQYVWVTHPGKDEPDMQNFNLVGKPKGVVAKERDAERRLLTDPRLPELFKKWNVKVVRYDQI